MVWALVSILPAVGALVGLVFVVRFFVRLSRRVERLSLRVDSLAERLGDAHTVAHQ